MLPSRVQGARRRIVFAVGGVGGGDLGLGGEEVAGLGEVTNDGRAERAAGPEDNVQPVGHVASRSVSCGKGTAIVSEQAWCSSNAGSVGG